MDCRALSRWKPTGNCKPRHSISKMARSALFMWCEIRTSCGICITNRTRELPSKSCCLYACRNDASPFVLSEYRLKSDCDAQFPDFDCEATGIGLARAYLCETQELCAVRTDRDSVARRIDHRTDIVDAAA